jgi:MbtH protein
LDEIMANPFDNENGRFIVLVNRENQHSLWPETFAVPEGWMKTFGPETRAGCIAYVDATWTDLRPASVAAAFAG